MEFIAQYYECFECLVCFVCIYLGLKSINEIIELYEYIKMKRSSDKITDMLEGVLEDIKNENPRGKHSKED